MIPARLFNSINQSLFEKGLINLPLLHQAPISGGSVNQSYAISTSESTFFIKINQKEKLPNLFEKEQSGLNVLRANTNLKVPFPLIVGSFESHTFLILEFIESAKPKPDFWETFGRGIAKLHRKTASQFGYGEENYVGSLRQENRKTADWTTFFIEQRLKTQIRLANENNRLDLQINRYFLELFDSLEGVFPEEPPALLHGDLWSGNFLCTREGQAAIMDPAVYYGHREMDLAMSHLFGGFDSRFYQAYDAAFPLGKGWEKRIEICNLYPLLVHVNLFGVAYTKRLKSVLKRILENTL
jgi:fructosamine-3-kinase